MGLVKDTFDALRAWRNVKKRESKYNEAHLKKGYFKNLHVSKEVSTRYKTSAWVQGEVMLDQAENLAWWISVLVFEGWAVNIFYFDFSNFFSLLSCEIDSYRETDELWAGWADSEVELELVEWLDSSWRP